jgi:predicted DNA-binding protein (MmcQ/YjbR family)
MGGGGRAARERTVARLRRLCLALPEAVERRSHGEPAWFAGKGRSFAFVDDHHHGAPHLGVWLPQPLGAQEALLARDPARFYRPPYVGASGWVGVVLDGKPDWDEVARLVREAYLLAAVPRLRRLAGGEAVQPRRAPRRRATMR